jgi:nitrate reductase molybdenum cofactor assembly chaperone NarJ/NarW
MDMLYKSLSALLGYPDAALRGALPEIAAVIGGSGALPGDVKARLADLLGRMAEADPYALEAGYVETFDRGRATSLHLFEHVHGESRDRGQAMVSLRETYGQAGITLEANELPDYLPVMLEYMALVAREESDAMLRDCAHILRSIGEALAARGSDYSAVLEALLAVAGEPALERKRQASPPAEKPLDEEWLEEPVIFGPAAACAAAARCRGATAAQSAPIQFVSRHGRDARSPR